MSEVVAASSQCCQGIHSKRCRLKVTHSHRRFMLKPTAVGTDTAPPNFGGVENRNFIPYLPLDLLSDRTRCKHNDLGVWKTKHSWEPEGRAGKKIQIFWNCTLLERSVWVNILEIKIDIQIPLDYSTHLWEAHNVGSNSKRCNFFLIFKFPLIFIKIQSRTRVWKCCFFFDNKKSWIDYWWKTRTMLPLLSFYR